MKIAVGSKLSVSTVCSSVFFVTGILLAVNAYFEHLHHLDIVRNDKLGLSSASIDYGADRLARYAVIAACLVIVIVLGRLRRSAWSVLLSSALFILLAIQCSVIVRMGYQPQFPGDLWSWMRFAASVLLAGSAITLGAGNIFSSIRPKAAN